ncbi:hypothetical protein [uncultured Rhodoblastus sp.]|uniref:hypothetical protein n=1 Tax=uncultured Rhodoblastus sp. TaxID=543037 RepID=UPI0025F569C1|nr:hypothetical protein [uncultured Rhodoblastus sp.]
MRTSLHTRLTRIEGQAPNYPESILADSPFSEEEIAAKMNDWRDEVAAGRAIRGGSVITFFRQAVPMSPEEWEASYCGLHSKQGLF